MNAVWSQGFGRNQKLPGFDPNEVDCACDDSMGRFRKTDAHDCGNSQCWMCHTGKYPARTATRQELASEIRLREQLEELDLDNA